MMRKNIGRENRRRSEKRSKPSFVAPDVWKWRNFYINRQADVKPAVYVVYRDVALEACVGFAYSMSLAKEIIDDEIAFQG